MTPASAVTTTRPLLTCFQMSNLAVFSFHNPQLINRRSAVEQIRLEAQAAAIVEMIGGVPFLAPMQSMKEMSKAVDIGCGTGAATVQIAAIFPSAKVYGLDISAVPEAVRKAAPANAAWAVGNVLDVDYNKAGDDVMSREIFAHGGLGYIFGRMLVPGINNWSRYFTTAYHSLQSGGILEHQDLNWRFYRVGTSQCLSSKWEWHQAMRSGMEKFGFSTRAGSDAASIMEAAGLEIISIQTFEYSYVPSSKTPNSQAMSRYVQAKLIPQYAELLRKLLGVQGITGEELERLTKESLRDIVSEDGLHQTILLQLRGSQKWSRLKSFIEQF